MHSDRPYFVTSVLAVAAGTPGFGWYPTGVSGDGRFILWAMDIGPELKRMLPGNQKPGGIPQEVIDAATTRMYGG